MKVSKLQKYWNNVCVVCVKMMLVLMILLLMMLKLHSYVIIFIAFNLRHKRSTLCIYCVYVIVHNKNVLDPFKGNSNFNIKDIYTINYNEAFYLKCYFM